MEGNPHTWDGPEVCETGSLSLAFRAALTAPDMRAARGLIAAAADQGVAPGRLYVEVVRPVLSELQQPGGPHARLAAEMAQAILADLVARVPVTAGSGSGRAAVLSCREVGIEAVDGIAATDFLEREGWSVAGVDGPARTPGSWGPDDLGSFELAVAVIGGPEDALRLAATCTALRRLPDPPVLLLCDFSGRESPVAFSALGADAFACDPQELAALAAERLPGSGRRRWGVRLTRCGGELTLAPTGTLDPVSVGRLADVVASRTGTFDRLVLDLRNVAVVRSDGLGDLSGWPERLRLGGVQLELITGSLAPSTLADAPLGAAWQLTA